MIIILGKGNVAWVYVKLSVTTQYFVMNTRSIIIVYRHGLWGRLQSMHKKCNFFRLNVQIKTEIYI